MYSMFREDGNGDSGGSSVAIWEEDDEVKFEHDARPRVGVCMQVGSTYARTMQYQDYWQTSYITEIIEDTPQKVVFKTKNSTYTWMC